MSSLHRLRTLQAHLAPGSAPAPCAATPAYDDVAVDEFGLVPEEEPAFEAGAGLPAGDGWG